MRELDQARFRMNAAFRGILSADWSNPEICKNKLLGCAGVSGLAYLPIDGFQSGIENRITTIPSSLARNTVQIRGRQPVGLSRALGLIGLGYLVAEFRAEILFDDVVGDSRVQGLQFPGVIIVSVRGSKTPRDYCLDSQVWPRRVCHCVKGRVHSGFYKSAREVSDHLLKKISGQLGSYPVWICGHSLGGATVALLSVMSQLPCFNIGAAHQRFSGFIAYGAPRLIFKGSLAASSAFVINEFDRVADHPLLYKENPADVVFSRRAPKKRGTPRWKAKIQSHDIELYIKEFM